MRAILPPVGEETQLTRTDGESQTQAGDSEVMDVFGWVEVGAQRYPLASGLTATIGRSPHADVVLLDPTVSHSHASIGLRDGLPTIWDLGSHNGTFADGVDAGEGGVVLRGDTVIHLGECEARFVAVGSEQRTRRLAKIRRYAVDRDLTIGRAPENDVVLDEPNVSRRHAVLRAGPPASIEDLGSRNGTRLGQDPVRVSALTQGDEIGVGHYRLTLDRGGVTVVDQRIGVGLQGVNLCATVPGRGTILHPTTLTVARGEVLALIGPSGSGKSTLLRLLAGVSKPSEGETTVDGEPIAVRMSDLGYVPQEDTIHARLTVREALACAAVLRLPSDTSEDEIAHHVEAVAAELDLAPWIDGTIGSLSGGQRKRVACGVELIGRPSIFLLDEPTSGLDPPLERQMMQTIRDLADEGRGVAVTTHATSSLSLCDTLAIMAPGGHLAFVGAPSAALERYGVAHYDELYSAAQPTQDLALDDGAPVEPRRASRLPHASRARSDRSLIRQLSVLTGRYVRTFARDRRTMLVLLGQVPAIALLIAALFPAGLLRYPDADPAKSAQFVFLLVTASIWIGLISSCREIVNERSIVLREFAVGSRIGAYMASKAIVLFGLAAVQVAMLLAFATVVQPLHEPLSGYVGLYGVLLATAWAAIAAGLAVSTLARSVDQATSFVPLLLIPQLLFAGALVTVTSMQPAVRILSYAIVARWAFAGAGSSIEMNSRLAGEPSAAEGYGHSFFALDPAVAIAAILVFVAAGLAVVGAMLNRRADV
jgi:ABC-type multidrug transport system ATPase subunit/pSer/pThr/pTyr-binding forkhead associated (FHA) protein/ABC-type multidrug transport system permease subunit